MSKIAVVYWSGTGNTETMANAVVEGAKSSGNEVDLFFSDDFNSSMVDDYSSIAFGPRKSRIWRSWSRKAARRPSSS